MIESIPALSTNVIATVRRDNATVALSGGQADTTQTKTAYVPQPTPITPEAAGNLSDLNEQIAQIMAKAGSAARIEPEGNMATLHGRATAAYKLVTNLEAGRPAPALSLFA